MWGSFFSVLTNRNFLLVWFCIPLMCFSRSRLGGMRELMSHLTGMFLLSLSSLSSSYTVLHIKYFTQQIETGDEVKFSREKAKTPSNLSWVTFKVALCSILNMISWKICLWTCFGICNVLMKLALIWGQTSSLDSFNLPHNNNASISRMI